MMTRSRLHGSKVRSNMKYNVLILGASYGSLFSTKLLMAGHNVSLVCTKGTADLINSEGTVVRFPIKGREGLLDISSKSLAGALSANPALGRGVNCYRGQVTQKGVAEALGLPYVHQPWRTG